MSLFCILRDNSPFSLDSKEGSQMAEIKSSRPASLQMAHGTESHTGHVASAIQFLTLAIRVWL